MEFMNRKIDRNGLLREVILSIKMAISPLLLLKRLERVGLSGGNVLRYPNRLIV
ncbi:hypothetical protein PRABACTJOHN_01322 [Parabacteroides johnsonii DSM 18315]|nr:hypothetical protein PRABACTJOHN_01322 [Parabacteroides johnsonii DSM 18315]